MSTLVEMMAVAHTRPGLTATSEEIAEWYLAKARLHENLAAEGGADAVQEKRYAISARMHAHQLLATTAA